MSKTLKSITLHGSQCGRHTNWRTWPGYAVLHFTDGSSRCMGDISYNEALALARDEGIDTAEFERQAAEWEKAHSYPPRPEAELYQHYGGYEKPVELGEWQWSDTFGRWCRLVTFADGWHGWTYPKTF